MLIDCDSCRMRDLACSDCVVTLLLGAPDTSLDLDSAETAAFSALAAGGLAPPLRLVPVRRHLSAADPTGLPGADDVGAGMDEHQPAHRVHKQVGGKAAGL